MARQPRIHRGSFLARIIDALGEHPHEVAKKLGIERAELLTLQHLAPGKLVEVNRSEIWELLDQHVSERLAGLFSIREELNRALARARREQMKNRIRTLERP